MKEEIDYYDFLDKALNLTRFLPFQLQPYFKQIIELTNKIEKSKKKYRKVFKRYLLNNSNLQNKEIEVNIKIKEIENKIDIQIAKKQRKVERLAEIIKDIHDEIFNTPGLINLPEITKPIKYSPCVIETHFTRENPNNNEIVCVCKKGSYGQMILCESDLCPIGWYHLSCTSLRKPQKTSFICKTCNSSKLFK